MGRRFRVRQIRSGIMTKSSTRGNREAKKPKQPKKVLAPAVGVSSTVTPKGISASAPARKK
jgi:hypothetical protein